MKTMRLAIDGNEANTSQRVGSNVYAYELLVAMQPLLAEKKITTTILLSRPPVADLPKPSPIWQYRVVKPRQFWTQLGEPIYLWLHKHEYDVLFTPGHYAPRLSSIPYVSSVMDVAYLDFPDQFQKNDVLQLKHWTKYSVAQAKKVVVISQATKQAVQTRYHVSPEKLVVAYPSLPSVQNKSVKPDKNFLKKHRIRAPYILFVGTFQPRKNLVRLVEGFEQLLRSVSSQSVTKNKKSRYTQLPQLVLAGKVGWLADPIMERIKASPFFEYIVTPGFVTESEKLALYDSAACSVLVGLHEGFGIPPLESLAAGCIPVVSNSSSLPEVVGEAGILVDPLQPSSIKAGLEKAVNLTAKQKARYRKLGREQVQKFDWSDSAVKVVAALESVVSTST